MQPIIKLAGEKDIEFIQKIAQVAWPAAYEGFLDPKFIDFEVKREYSRPSLLDAIKKGEAFYLAETAIEGILGFFALSQPSPSSVKLNKFYLSPKFVGKGWGRKVFTEIEKICKSYPGAQKIQLLVNRSNAAVQFYKRMNFKIVGEVDTPTSSTDSSFIRRDYIMEKDLAV